MLVTTQSKSSLKPVRVVSQVMFWGDTFGISLNTETTPDKMSEDIGKWMFERKSSGELLPLFLSSPAAKTRALLSWLCKEL